MLNLCDIKFELLKDYIIGNNYKIAIYGAGMIGRTIMPDYLMRHGLDENLLFYVDADTRKQKQKVIVGLRQYNICAPEVLNNIGHDTIILITNSNYSPVLHTLDAMESLDGIKAVIVPVIMAEGVKDRAAAGGGTDVIRDYTDELIPKVINYCWFSGRKMPDYLKRCIDSWSRICPDYEIKRWDESNYDVNKNEYMRQAYEEVRWGFVPDYARLDILYNYGGFYIDTDVELLKPLEPLRRQGAFCGVEKWGNVNMGGCSGAIPHHRMIKKLLKYREEAVFRYEDGSLNPDTCGVYETAPFIAMGMSADNTCQRINEMTVFSSEYFHPYDYMSGENVITENTFSIHHFNGGWLDDKRKEERKKTVGEYNNILKRIYGQADYE